MTPLWVQLWSFHSSRFYCLTCGDLKKGGDVKKKRYKGRERRSRTRKKEREEKDVKKRKKKIIIIMKNYKKKKNPKLAGQASFAGLLWL